MFSDYAAGVKLANGRTTSRSDAPSGSPPRVTRRRDPRSLPRLDHLVAVVPVGASRAIWAEVPGGAALAAASVLVSDLLIARPGVWGTLVETFVGPAAVESLSANLERGLYGTTPTGSWWWLAVRAPHSGTPFDLAHTIGTSLLVIALCVTAGRLAPRLLAVAFGAGAMTLTLYSAHVVLRSPGLWDSDTMSTFLGQVALVLLVGAAFRLARRRGPLEAGVGEVQAAVRRAAAGTPRR